MTVHHINRSKYSSRNWRTRGEKPDTGRWLWSDLHAEWASQPAFYFAVFDRPAALTLAALSGRSHLVRALGGEL